MKANSHISFRKFSLATLLILLFFTTIKVDIGSVWVAAYIIIIFIATFREIQFIKQNIKVIFLNTYIKKKSSIHKFGRGKIFTVLFSIIPALLISISLSVFMYRTGWIDNFIIFMSLISYYFLYSFFEKILKSHLSKNIKYITPLIVSSFIIVPLTGVTYYLFHFFDSPSFELASPEMVDHIVNNVTHSSTVFRNIVRTSYYIDLNIYTSKNIPGYGQYIFPFIYSVSASLIPFAGITLISQMLVRFMTSSPSNIK